MKNKEATRYFSNLQESHVSKALGGTISPNSGASRHCAGDVIIPETMVIECKTVTKEQKSWTIKQEWLEQNEKERLDLMLPHSALAISLDPSGENNLYVINENLMKLLVKTIRGEETI
jgi:hypothetical protein|nr:MAG TPA: hypothetical protein [Caudoviricetes sp.]